MTASRSLIWAFSFAAVLGLDRLAELSVQPFERDGGIGRHSSDGRQEQGDGRHKCGDLLVAAAPAHQPLASPDGTCQDRPALEESLQVIGKLTGALVPFGRIFLKALQADGFEVDGDIRLEAGTAALVPETEPSSSVSRAEAPWNGGWPTSIS